MLEKIIQKNTEKSEISEQLKGLREQLTLLENKIKDRRSTCYNHI